MNCIPAKSRYKQPTSATQKYEQRIKAVKSSKNGIITAFVNSGNSNDNNKSNNYNNSNQKSKYSKHLINDLKKEEESIFSYETFDQQLDKWVKKQREIDEWRRNVSEAMIFKDEVNSTVSSLSSRQDRSSPNNSVESSTIKCQDSSTLTNSSTLYSAGEFIKQQQKRHQQQHQQQQQQRQQQLRQKNPEKEPDIPTPTKERAFCLVKKSPSIPVYNTNSGSYENSSELFGFNSKNYNTVNYDYCKDYGLQYNDLVGNYNTNNNEYYGCEDNDGDGSCDNNNRNNAVEVHADAEAAAFDYDDDEVFEPADQINNFDQNFYYDPRLSFHQSGYKISNPNIIHRKYTPQPVKRKMYFPSNTFRSNKGYNDIEKKESQRRDLPMLYNTDAVKQTDFYYSQDQYKQTHAAENVMQDTLSKSKNIHKSESKIKLVLKNSSGTENKSSTDLHKFSPEQINRSKNRPNFLRVKDNRDIKNAALFQKSDNNPMMMTVNSSAKTQPWPYPDYYPIYNPIPKSHQPIIQTRQMSSQLPPHLMRLPTQNQSHTIFANNNWDSQFYFNNNSNNNVSINNNNNYNNNNPLQPHSIYKMNSYQNLRNKDLVIPKVSVKDTISLRLSFGSEPSLYSNMSNKQNNGKTSNSFVRH